MDSRLTDNEPKKVRDARRKKLCVTEPCPGTFVRSSRQETVSLIDEQTVEVRFAIAPGYYLYRNKLAFALDPAVAETGPANLPEGLPHEDKYFGKQQIYRDALRFTVPLKTPVNGPVTLVVTHQGCADMGVCYPPSKIALPLKLENMSHAGVDGKPKSALLNSLGGKESAPPLIDTPASTPAAATTAPQSTPADSRPERVLAGGNLLLVAAIFFGLGLLLCFTPCTLPMVPILSSIIVGHGHTISHRRAGVLSTAYVIGMAVTYAIAGVAAGFAGQLLQVWMQNPWVLGGFALIFVVLALAMFGVYELRPARHSAPACFHARPPAWATSPFAWHSPCCS